MAGIEIERKYVIKLPSINKMMEAENFTSSKVTQIYLASGVGITHRVRRREYERCVVYTETKKTRIDRMSVVEDEREISEAEFLALSKNIKEGTKPIVKTRYTFTYRNNLIEIDVYPNWSSTCIMETELRNREDEVEFPDFIEIVKEVTGELEYSNAAMARSFPKESRLI